MLHRIRTLGGLPAALLFIVLLAHQSHALTGRTMQTPQGQIGPRWQLPLPTATCPWSAADANCHSSSPVVADVNGDGRRDVVVATNNGHVLAVSGGGAVIWDADVSGALGVAPSTAAIASSPAVDDLDGDGAVEIVVGTGTLDAHCRPGAVVVLDRNGQMKPNWPQLARDNGTSPRNCPDPIVGTPALGDLDNDGDLEIVVGGFDKRVYAWHHDGRMLAGFPADSALYARLGWPNLRGQLADTIWSSPALADIDLDGYLDIVIGSDEGNFDGSYPGDSGGWTCPYLTPSGRNTGYCGGTLYAFDRQGRTLPGFPKRILEIVQSTPAVIDAIGDERPEIFVGTGTFYHDNSPDRPTNGYRLHAWDNKGKDLPGWEGGKAVGGLTPASPAVGDIAGDGQPEIVVPAMDGKLYAWHHTGAPVAGFPMTPRDQLGQTMSQNVGKSPILADYDGDGKMEIFLTLFWVVAVIDGDGRQLTGAGNPSDPYYLTGGSLLNNAAIADLDSDGDLELIAQNSRLTVWDLPRGGTRADWPMFKRNAARTSALTSPRLYVAPMELTITHAAGASLQERRTVTMVVPSTRFDWTASGGAGSYVTVIQGDGRARSRADVALQISVPSNLRPGTYTGAIELRATNSELTIRDNRRTIPIRLRVLDLRYKAMLPVVQGAAR